MSLRDPPFFNKIYIIQVGVIMKRIKLLIIISICILFGLILNSYIKSPYTPGFGIYPTLNESEQDIARLIELTLKRVLVNGHNREVSWTIKQNEPVPLSLVNIRKEWIPPIKGVKIRKLSIDEIRKIADEIYLNQGDAIYFWYLEFGRIVLQSPEYALVELNRWYIYRRNSTWTPDMFGETKTMNITYENHIHGQAVYLYHKLEGKWVLQIPTS
jgi:hypothetical protein